MTDKEKLDKIIAEIKRLRESLKVISAASPSRDTTLENIAKAALCKQILSYIDSMQEEPTTSVWHDASERPVASKTKIVLYTNGKWDIFKAYETKDDYDNYWAGVNQSLAEKGVFVKQWSYVDDLLKL